MIKLLDEVKSEYFSILNDNHYKRKIKSSYGAYKCEYDFCRFYLIENENVQGIICMFNSTMTISIAKDCVYTDEFVDDIVLFIEMNKPSQVETEMKLSGILHKYLTDIYVIHNRTLYELENKLTDNYDEPTKPEKLDDVFNILKQSFPDLNGAYEKWLTDTSHRVRHGFADVYIYDKKATAMVQYKIDDVAFIGYVATLPEARGQGLARKLIAHICGYYSHKGYKAQLLARDHRVSFYNELGFTKISDEVLFERKK